MGWGSRGVEDGEELVEGAAGGVGQREGAGSCAVEEGAEVAGVAREEVAVHVVQRVFDLRDGVRQSAGAAGKAYIPE